MRNKADCIHEINNFVAMVDKNSINFLTALYQY